MGPQIARKLSDLAAAGYDVNAISNVMSIGAGGDGAACDLKQSLKFASADGVFVTPRDAFAAEVPEIGSPLALCVTAQLTELKVRHPGGKEVPIAAGPERGLNATLYIFSTGFDDAAGTYLFSGYDGTTQRFSLPISIRESLTPRILERRPSTLMIDRSSTVEFLTVGLRADTAIRLYKLRGPPSRGGLNRYDLLATMHPVVDGRGRSRIQIIVDLGESGDCIALHVSPPKPGNEYGG
jgi:hypothetical protein